MKRRDKQLMGKRLTLPLVADGIGSCSELTGDDPDNVCCEENIIKHPELLTADKKASLKLGFNALLSPTGDITHARLEDLGFDDSFEDYIETLTELTIAASDNSLPVGGVIRKSDPIASEYGENVFESAYFAHLEQINLLKDAGASFILLRNFDKLWDMRAGVLAAKSADIPVLVTMQVDDEGQSAGDTDYIAALITLQALGADGFGIECTEGASLTAELIGKAFSHAEIPLIAEVDLQKTESSVIMELCENGASVFINTARECRSENLELIRNSRVIFDPGEEKDSYAATIFREAFFLPEYIELSQPLMCDLDMSDELIDFDDEAVNAIFIHLNSTDDAAFLADNASMTSLPFVVSADDPTVLEAALRYYQGRLIVDGQCGVEKDQLQRLVKKYGALLY